MVWQMFVLVGLIGFAGAVGALTRYTVGLLVMRFVNTLFPWGTLLINVSGAFLIGLLAGLANSKAIAPQVQAVLATGFLGGYTTFSTLSWEGMQLLREGNTRQGVFYLGGNYIPGLLAAALGLLLGGLA